MPVHESKDRIGMYFQWGHHGKKYYYQTNEGRINAYRKALRQGQAAHANGYH